MIFEYSDFNRITFQKSQYSPKILPFSFHRDHYTQADSVTYHYLWFGDEDDVSDTWDFPHLIIPEFISCCCLWKQSEHRHIGLGFKTGYFEVTENMDEYI